MSVLQVHNYLYGLPLLHKLETMEFFKEDLMGNNRVQIEPLPCQEIFPLIPRLEHSAAVNAVNRDSVKYDFVSQVNII